MPGVPNFSAADYRHMSAAIRHARAGWYSCRPNPRVGCVLVKDGEIVGSGAHLRAGERHAERAALDMAGERARGACCYVTLEPCCHSGRTPPCSDALIAAGVARVCYAGEDPNPSVRGQGARQLRAAGIAVESGLLAETARRLNAGFMQRMAGGRPRVTIKIAMSLDAQLASASGDSRWITGEQARADVQRLRAESGAILTGVDTVIADDPALTVRDPRFDPPEQPLRVIVDTHLRMPVNAALLALPGRTIVFTALADDTAVDRLTGAGAAVYRVGLSDGRVDLQQVLDRLADLQVNDILVEAGPTLTGSLITQGLADELIIYIAPRLIGRGGRAALAIPGVAELSTTPWLDITDNRRLGVDWRLSARIVS